MLEHCTTPVLLHVLRAYVVCFSILRSVKYFRVPKAFIILVLALSCWDVYYLFTHIWAYAPFHQFIPVITLYFPQWTAGLDSQSPRSIWNDLFTNLATATWSTDLLSMHVTLPVFMFNEIYRFQLFRSLNTVQQLALSALLLLASIVAMPVIFALFTLYIYHYEINEQKQVDGPTHTRTELMAPRSTSPLMQSIYIFIAIFEFASYAPLWVEWCQTHCWIEEVHTESRTTELTTYTNQVVILMYCIFLPWAAELPAFTFGSATSIQPAAAVTATMTSASTSGSTRLFTTVNNKWLWEFLWWFFHTIAFHNQGLAWAMFLAWREYNIQKFHQNEQSKQNKTQ